MSAGINMKTLLERHVHFTSLLMTLVGLLAFSCPALAALGGDASSVEVDRAHMKATVKQTQVDGYSIQEIKAPGGTVVNEYVSPAGRVFAVTWHGPFVPEMQQILGAYFQQFSAALQAQPRHYGRRPLNIQQPGLVVQTSGHMRAYWGRAYVPEMLPQGVKDDEIK